MYTDRAELLGEAGPDICRLAVGEVVFIPTNPVEPVANILMFPAPSDMKTLQFCVSNPAAVAEPRITLQTPVVIQRPALIPTAVLLIPLVFLYKEQRPTAVLPVPVVS